MTFLPLCGFGLNFLIRRHIIIVHLVLFTIATSYLGLHRRPPPTAIGGHAARDTMGRPAARNFGTTRVRHSTKFRGPGPARARLSLVPGPLPQHDGPARHGTNRGRPARPSKWPASPATVIRIQDKTIQLKWPASPGHGPATALLCPLPARLPAPSLPVASPRCPCGLRPASCFPRRPFDLRPADARPSLSLRPASRRRPLRCRRRPSPGLLRRAWERPGMPRAGTGTPKGSRSRARACASARGLARHGMEWKPCQLCPCQPCPCHLVPVPDMPVPPVWTPIPTATPPAAARRPCP